MAQVAICDDTTGEIVAYIIVPDGDVAANLDTGQVAVAITEAVSTVGQYIDDPTGTPTVEARPDFACVIPDSLAVGSDLSITDVPDGATVTITSTGSGGGSHTKSGGLGTLDATISGASDGDLLTVEIELWPYRTLSGECFVYAP